MLDLQRFQPRRLRQRFNEYRHRSEIAVAVQETLDRAEQQIGWRSLAKIGNPYLAAVGLVPTLPASTAPWAGPFVQSVLPAGTVPAFTDTLAALSAYRRLDRERYTPEPGDVVFFNFPSQVPGPPHIGIVSDTREFRKRGAFQTIEGNTASGQARGSQDPDGVYPRTRYRTDILAIIRPLYWQPQPEEKEFITAVPDPGQHEPNDTLTQLIQIALNKVLGPDAGDFAQGKYDAQTRSALSFYARSRGIGPHRAIAELGKETGLFSFEN